MSDTVTGGASHRLPTPVDLTGVDTRHPDSETPAQLLSTAVAETAASITGVHRLGGVAARTLDRASRKIRGTSTAPGVNVSEEDGVTTIDLDLIAEYPHPLDELIAETREQVARAARQLAAGPVEVNVTVTDVHGPFDTEPVLEQAADRAGALADAAGQKAGELKDAATEKAGDLKASAEEKTAELKRAAADKVNELKDQAADVKDAADAEIDEFQARADDRVAEFAEKADEIASDRQQP